MLEQQIITLEIYYEYHKSSTCSKTCDKQKAQLWAQQSELIISQLFLSLHFYRLVGTAGYKIAKKSLFRYRCTKVL